MTAASAAAPACAKIEGEVDYLEEPLEELDPGQVLICSSRPKGDLVIDA